MAFERDPIMEKALDIRRGNSTMDDVPEQERGRVMRALRRNGKLAEYAENRKDFSRFHNGVPAKLRDVRTT